MVLNWFTLNSFRWPWPQVRCQFSCPLPSCPLPQSLTTPFPTLIITTGNDRNNCANTTTNLLLILHAVDFTTYTITNNYWYYYSCFYQSRSTPREPWRWQLTSPHPTPPFLVDINLWTVLYSMTGKFISLKI